jgi:pimeloyl-ACP methyl ester carboxylesterase
MSPKRVAKTIANLNAKDMRGLAQLATEATIGVSGITEGVHQSVLGTLGVAADKSAERTSGLTGMVYRGINKLTMLVGHGVGVSLSGIELFSKTDANKDSESRHRQTALAMINGVLGDHLVETKNPLATPMSLRHQGNKLDAQTIPSIPGATTKIVLFVHGLCMTDQHWQPGSKDGHAEALAKEMGYTPVFVRYNSGLPIVRNGRELSIHLEELVSHWPVPVKEISIVAHSMGGLVSRHAVDRAIKNKLDWSRALHTMVFLGTPHQGAPLEKAGGWVDAMLGSNDYSLPFSSLSKLRSAGITDLRHGYGQQDLPLPQNVSCYTIAATTAAKRGLLADQLTGDGLVPLNSALGIHSDPGQSLSFPATGHWIVYSTGHIELLKSEAVTRKLMEWLAQKRKLIHG